MNGLILIGLDMKKKIVKYLHCFQCGYDWTPRIFSKPKQCPRCKRYWWDVPRKTQEARA